MKTAIVPREPFRQVSKADMNRWVSDTSLHSVADIVNDMSDYDMKRFDSMAENGDDSDKAIELYARVYMNASRVAAYFNSKLDKLRNAIIETGTLTSEHYALKFSREGGNVKSVEYDLEALKKENRKLYDKVTYRTGKPMTKPERAKLDKKAEELKAELAEVNMAIIKDNADRQVYVNEDMFTELAKDNTELDKYKTVKLASYRFNVRELKEDE